MLNPEEIENWDMEGEKAVSQIVETYLVEGGLGKATVIREQNQISIRYTNSNGEDFKYEILPEGTEIEYAKVKAKEWSRSNLKG